MYTNIFGCVCVPGCVCQFHFKHCTACSSGTAQDTQVLPLALIFLFGSSSWRRQTQRAAKHIHRTATYSIENSTGLGSQNNQNHLQHIASVAHNSHAIAFPHTHTQHTERHDLQHTTLGFFGYRADYGLAKHKSSQKSTICIYSSPIIIPHTRCTCTL